VDQQEAYQDSSIEKSRDFDSESSDAWPADHFLCKRVRKIDVNASRESSPAGFSIL
jgi:hypothetical protein